MNQIGPKPEDLLALEDAMRNMHSYLIAIKGATWAGKDLKSASNLQDFLNQSYQQLIAMIQNHPWVEDLQRAATETVEPSEEGITRTEMEQVITQAMADTEKSVN